MAIYEVAGPDGTIYEIEGPEGATDKQLIGATQRYIFQEQRRQEEEARRRAAEERARQEPAIKPETTVGGNIKELFKGVIPGAAGLLETAGTGIAAILPEDTEKAARQKLKEIAGVVKESETFKAAPGYEESVGRKFGEALGSTLPFFALGPAGIAGRVAAGGLGISAGAGEARERAEEAGATGGERRAATLLGAPTGILDILAPNIGPLRNMLRTALARGGVEGATEAAQQVSQNLIAKGVYDPNQPIFAGAGEEGAYGAGVGALSSLILDMTLGRRARLAAEARRKEQETAAPTPETEAAAAPAPEVTPTPTPEAEAAAAPAPEVTPTPTPETEAAAAPTAEPTAEPTPEAVTAKPEPTKEEEKLQFDGATEVSGKEVIDTVGIKDKTVKKSIAKAQFFKGTAIPNYLPTAEQIMSKPDPYGRQIKIDPEKVQSYAARLRAGEQAPPIVVDNNGVILDGMHRALAAKQANVPIQIYKLTPSERTKGLKLTAEEKAAVEKDNKAKLEAAEKPQNILTKDFLSGFGLPKRAPIVNRLANKDIFNPEDRAVVKQELETFIQNPKITPEVKGKVESFLNTPYFTTPDAQFQKLITEPAVARIKEQQNAETASQRKARARRLVAKQQRAGAGAEVREPSVKQPAQKEAAPTAKELKPPKPAGVELGVPPAGRAGERAGEQQPPLKTEEQKAVTRARNILRKKKYTEEEISDVVKSYTDEVTGFDEAAFNKANFNLVKDSIELLSPLDSATLGKIKANDLAGALAEIGRGSTATAKIARALSKAVSGVNVQVVDFKGKNIPAPLRAALEQLTPNQVHSGVYVIDRRGPLEDLKTSKSALDAFNPSVIEKHSDVGYKSKDKLIEMKIDDFLSLTAKGVIKEKEKKVAGIRGEGKQFNTLPQLFIDNGIVSGHEGRHRARQLKKEGYKTMPVLLGAYSPQIRWSEQDNPENSDYVKNWPKKLTAQEGAEDKTFSIPFPVLREQATKPYTLGKPASYIYLDAASGVDEWTLLHEATHAATVGVLKNKAHPATKQITSLYETIKDSMDTIYGARSVEEFVAEAFSNPEFRSKLASITPKGEPITAWQRFSRSVTNLVRSLMRLNTKPIGSALDATDTVINDILAASPDQVGVGDIETALALNKGEAVLQGMDRQIRKVTKFDNEVALNVVETVRTLPDKIQKLILGSLPLNAYVEVIKSDIPMASKVYELEKLWNGSVSKTMGEVEATYKNAKAWAQKNPEKNALLSKVVSTSTLEEVHPGIRRDSYGDKEMTKSGRLKRDVWDELQSDWKAMGSDGQAIYEQIRKSYENYFDRAIDLMYERVKSSGAEFTKSKSEFKKYLATKGYVHPYFALTRKGKYWLSYNYKGEKYQELFETSTERDNAMDALVDGGATDVEAYEKVVTRDYRSAPPESFINTMLRTLQANRVDPKVTDELMRAVVEVMPEASFAKAFQRRKGTLGFNPDPIEAFYSKGMSMARQIARLEYAPKLAAVQNEVDQHVKVNNNTADARRMQGILNDHIQTIINPNIATWSKTATNIAFNWTLGLNVSGAIVNMSQIPLIVMPVLGGKYGYSETVKALGKASKIFFGSGLQRDVKMSEVGPDGKTKLTVPAMYSLDNYDFEGGKVPQELKYLKELVDVAKASGTLSRSTLSDVLDMDSGSTVLNKVNAITGAALHHGERLNRQVTLMAAYDLELQAIAKGRSFNSLSTEERVEAANKAYETMELTNGSTSAGSAPALAKTNVGRILYMYKRFGLSMYYLMYRTANQMLKGETAEVRSAAKRQLLGITASAGILAGVQGVPMAGMLMAIYNLFRDEDEPDAEQQLRVWLGEGYYNGAINALTGTEVASRIGLSDLLFHSTGYRQQDNALLSFLQLMGGPVYGVFDRMQRGAKLINEGEIQRGMEQISPSAFGNLSKGVRFYTEGATTLRGDPITSEIGLGHAMAQMVGFAPAEYIRQLEENASLKGINRTVNERRSALLRKYYIATRLGDSDAAADIMEQMMELSRKHPGAAITAKTIISSMKQHMRTSATMYHGVSLDKKLMPELLSYTREVDED